MKKYFQLLLALSALLPALTSRAWNYSDGDAILVFRASGFNDVEFNLGNISQFTNVPSGTTITVTNWNRALATNTFGTDLSGLGVALVATTSWTNVTANKFSWITAADTNGTVNNFTPSGWQSKLSLVISSIGQAPLTYLLPSNQPAAYSIDPSQNSVDKKASYDFIVSGGNYTSIEQFGGNAPFTVEAVIPSNFSLWRIAPTGLATSAAYVGTFSLSASGVLTFKAGSLAPAAPTITSITRSGTLTTVTFPTSSGASYTLAYTNVLRGAAATWPVVSGPIAGDGTAKSLTHTTSGTNGFYRLIRTP